jgi:hypothetical protein
MPIGWSTPTTSSTDAEQSVRSKLQESEGKRPDLVTRKVQYLTLALEHLQHTRNALEVCPAAARAVYHAMEAQALAMVDDSVFRVKKRQHHKKISGLGGRSKKRKRTITKRQTRWRERVCALAAEKRGRTAQQIRLRYQEEHGKRYCPIASHHSEHSHQEIARTLPRQFARHAWSACDNNLHAPGHNR